MDFFPSAKVRLIIRLEEFSRDFLRGKAPPKSPLKMKGSKAVRAPSRVVEDTDEYGVRVYRLVPNNLVGATSGAGQAQSGSSDGLTQEVGGIIPVQATWRQTGIRQGDTLSLSLRWADFPFDPRVVRTCAVEYFLGTVTPQDFAQGVGGASRSQGFKGVQSPDTGQPLMLVPDQYVDAQGRARTNLRFQGWVDKFQLALNDDDPIVKLECSDNTILFAKATVPPDYSLDKTLPIDEAIAAYLSAFPRFAGIGVKYLPVVDRSDVPKLKGIISKAATVPHLGPPPSKGGSPGVGESLSVWDFLTDICAAIGHTIRVEGLDVVVQKVVSLVAGSAPRRAADPYEGRSTPAGDFPVRALIYGQNCESVEFSHEYTRKEAKNIEVRAWDPGRNPKLMVAKFPKAAQRVTTAGPGDGKVDQDWLVKIVSGISDQKTLDVIAENLYHSRGRTELEVAVKTCDVASYGGDGLDPDLLDMKAGDTFDVLLDRTGDVQSTGTELESALTSMQLNQKLMGSLGYSDEFASAYAKAYTDADFQRAFRLAEMTAEWSPEDGISLELRGRNYLETRLDPSNEDAIAGGTATPNVTPAILAAQNRLPKG